MVAFVMRIYGATILFAAGALCGAQTTAPAPSARTYHSEAMSFDFAYPDSFADPRSADSAASEKPDANCVAVPLSVADMRTSFNMISVKEYDETCLKTKQAAMPGLGSAATSYLTDTLSRLGKPSVSSTANYELAGRNASTVSGTVKLSPAPGSNTIHGAVSCVSTGKGIACVQFLANDCPGLALITASTVKFVGTVAAPMISPGIGAACKP